MAAEVDFGDRELFEQLDSDGAESSSEGDGGEGAAEEQLRRRLRDCEESVRRLQAEILKDVEEAQQTITVNGELSRGKGRKRSRKHRELRRKLNILTRPSGLEVDDSKLDGPLLQILFTNSSISKQYHQEIEDFISSLVERYEEQQRADHEKTSFNIKPQPSSFVLEENYKVTRSNPSKKVKEAFSVVGSVLYFTHFCLDKLGQPILNENPQLTDGWEIPKYQQVFSQILSLEGQEIQVKPKRPKAHCFNCGSEDHQMKDCPQPRNAARISEKRKQFMDACGEMGAQNFQQRYHAEEVEERFGRFKPGIISEELQDALGVTDKSLPPFIYRMRQLGYPPGWLKEAELEKSGLTLYDGKASPGGEMEEDYYHQKQRVTYDVSKLINYPGFNMSPPSGVSDEWRLFGSIPLQPSQQKDIFAHYLSTYHSATPKSNTKRASSYQSLHNPKRLKGNGAEVASADMEIDSDMEAARYSPGYGGFQFQPPLPPGSPLSATPPPLPQGTPPCTPPPPLRNPSPFPPSRDSASSRVEEPGMDEDTLTLEELEEQQRLIWAALEQADGANSDSDIPAGASLTRNSGTSSPSRTESDPLPETAGKDVLEVGVMDDAEQIPKEEPPDPTRSSADELIDLTEDDPIHVDAGAVIGSSACEGDHLSSPTVTGADSSKYATPVPDMSKFAVGITPFEFENMAESSGVYLRIRSVLKNSPRNQQKSKKTSF